MPSATIDAETAQDLLQQLEIYHHSLRAIAVSLERHGLEPVDVTQLKECAQGLGDLRASLAETLPPLPDANGHSEVVPIAWQQGANAAQETVAQAQGAARALQRMAEDLEEEAFEAGHARQHLDADDPAGRRGMIYTDARLAPMARMAYVLNQAAKELQAIAREAKSARPRE